MEKELKRRLLYLFFSFFIFSSACLDKKEQKGATQKGMAIYQATCTACHNSDPKKPGSLGPEVWGASLELLKKRIKEGAYPTGYTPKRSTKLMQPIPQLSNEDIQALHTYLNQRE